MAKRVYFARARATRPLRPKRAGYIGQPPRLHYFARIGTFAHCCPNCGELEIVWGSAKSKTYNRLTGVWTCRTCHARFLIGLACWPVAHRPGDFARPIDQTPDYHQAESLRTAQDTKPQNPIHQSQLEALYFPERPRAYGEALNLSCVNCPTYRGLSRLDEALESQTEPPTFPFQHD